MNDPAQGDFVTIRTAERQGAVVIRVEGEVDMDTCDVVRAEVVDRLRRGPDVVVLDLTAVTVFGSVGLSLLIEVRHRAERRGTRFAVATDRRAVLTPLAQTGVGDLLLLTGTVDEAVLAARAEEQAPTVA
jgi:anti-sigma B factor antagonist